VLNNKKRRGRKLSSVLTLSGRGYLMVPAKLLPSDARGGNFRFVIEPHPVEKKLLLRHSNNGGYHGNMPTRKATFSNDSAKSATVYVMSALRFFGVEPPEKPIELAVQKKSDGSLEIQF
jgi:hypothetical protein